MDRNLPWWNYPPEEQQGLETLVRRYSTPQQLARRGRIILSAAAGLNNSQIAREVGLDVDTVRFWRNRWLGLQAAILEDLSIEERLRDAPRPGAPARIPQSKFARSCPWLVRPPASAVVLSASGPARELADEIIEKGIVERISPRHAARLLERGT